MSNVLLVFEIGGYQARLETRLYFFQADEEELEMLKKCNQHFLDCLGNTDDEQECLEWLNKEVFKGKFSDKRIKGRPTLEKEDVPTIVIISGCA